MKNLNFQGIFDELPGTYLILEPNPPHFTILAFNKARAIATMSDSSVLGKDLFEVFSDNPNNPAATGVSRLRDSLMAVLETKKMQTMALQRYDLFNPSTNNYEERYWLPKNIPVLSSDNNMEYIIHSVEDISDEVFLRQREKSIKTEVKRLHDEQTKILESVGDAFVSIDEDWIVKYWNNRAENILSIQRNTIIGKCLWDFVKPECNQKLFQNFNLVVANNNPVFFETFYKPTNVWLQISAYPSNKGMTAFLIDITQRKMAEQVLERSERKYRSLVENISDGILTISEKGVIIDVSSSVKKIVGYEQERILGKNWSEMIHQDDRNRVLSAFQYTIGNADKSRTIEFRIKTSLEGYKWLEGTFHNLLDEDSIKAFALNFRDISEKRLHQEQLLESEAKYRYLFENSPATKLVWTLNNLQIREVNQTAINNFGYTRDEFLGMTVLDIWPVEEHERFMNLLNELKNGVEPADAEAWPYLKKNGELVYMNVSFHRIEFAHLPAIMVLAINVTEKILLERKLNEERSKRQREITEAVLIAQENERADLGKELHDNINQILTTARLYLEYVLSKKEDPQDLITQSHMYITKAIGEIRVISRNLLLPSLEEIRLKDALDDLFGNFKALNNIKLKFFYSVTEEDRINSKVRLTIFRIIQEQINNILKHSKATEVVVNISLNGQLRLQIIDNGSGFNTENVTSGLGLKNIRSRANLLGGTVTLHSKIGSGTELVVNFPIS